MKRIGSIGLSRVIASVLVFAATAGSAYATPVYFLVAEVPGTATHFDSFVVPLEDPGHIAHARDLIARGPELAGDPIVVANIAPGSDGINRDYLAPGMPLWSWHVTSVEGFAFTTMEILDGWPTFIEDDVDGWMANTGGKIGFWGYTVVEELEEVPEPSGAALACLGLAALVWVRRRLFLNGQQLSADCSLAKTSGQSPQSG